MTAGDLSVQEEDYIGYTGTGTFTQSAGTNAVNNNILDLGSESGASGTYNLSGTGSLLVNEEIIGDYGRGTFTQTGGWHSIASGSGIYLGYNSGATGSYTLSDPGYLTASFEYIGYYGTGTFTQTGGTNSISNLLNFSAPCPLYLGNAPGSSGRYNLSGTGYLSARYEYIDYSSTFTQDGGNNSTSIEYIGYSGIGTFKQTGGTNSIGSYLYLGYNSGSSGTYNLSGTGKLSADSEYIGCGGTGTFTQTGGMNTSSYLWLGFSGTGIFTQTGGTNTISSFLILGASSASSSGTYNLSGTGQLSADYETIGDSGTGTFTQDGGSNSASFVYLGSSGTGTFTQTGGMNTISSSFYLGYYSGSNGTYNLNGGTLVTHSIIQGSPYQNQGPGTAAFNFGGGTLQAGAAFSSSLPMTLTGTGGNANFDTAGYAVTLSGVLSGSGGLNKLGSGTLTLSATAIYGGNTTVNGGALVFTGGIGAGGTKLLDIESGTAILKTTTVSKSDLDIYTAASTLFEVANGPHTVGDISGSGTTQLDSGASLTATSISQNSLTIGSGATVTIQAIASGSLGGTITPVPEPGAWVLLATACFALFVTYARPRRK
jgi:hypothetical protein